MARGVLIDTSAWIEAMRREGDRETRALVEDALRSNRAKLCDLVRLELWNGAGDAAERRWLSKLEQTLETVPTDERVWRLARELARDLRRQGLTIPATDVIIGACARVHQLEVLHRDAHFEHLTKARPEEP